MNTEVQTQGENKIGAWKGGWLLLRASWSALKADKELVSYPLMSIAWTFIYAVFVMAVTVGAAVAWGVTYETITTSQQFPLPEWFGVLMGLVMFIGIFFIGNFYTAALIASAIHRFNGGDPDVKYGLMRARLRRKSLMKFALLQGSVGYALQIAEERLPIAGKISAYIADAAWNLAIFFAIPVIVMSDQEIGPINATRQSAKIFLKTWGKNFTGGLTMGLIFLIAFLFWAGLVVGSIVLAAAVASWTLFVTVPILIFIFISLFVVSGTLSSIFTAALYHYATTGQSPAEFDHNLMLAAFKPKKKWFA